MNKKEILVLSGGSLKGIAHLGVLKALDEKNILKNIKTFAGTSIGGIISALCVIGYNYNELWEISETLNFGLMRDIQLEKILENFGVDDGKKITIVLDELFKAKEINPNITFNELYEKTKVELILSTVCLNDKKIVYLSYKSFPDMKVITGLRMTSCVPFWFSPIKHNDKLYVDGAVMNNYPINIFKENKKRTIGVYLNEVKNNIEKINNIETFLFSNMDCIFEGINDILIKSYEKQTINLILPKISIFDLSINNKKKKELFDFGYNETIIFFNKIITKNEIKKIKSKNEIKYEMK